METKRRTPTAQKSSRRPLGDTGGIRTPNLLGRNQRHYPIVLRYQLVILFCSRALFLPDCDAKVGLIFELAIPKPYFFYLFFLDLCHFSLKTQ